MPTKTQEKQEARESKRVERLAGAVAALRSSDGFQQWLRTRKAFHTYSFRNTILIAVQCPEATYVAGFKKWINLGRVVRKGEKGIAILAPAGPSKSEQEAAKAEGRKPRMFFRDAYVFDLSQTDPIEGVQQISFDRIEREPIEGSSHVDYIGVLLAKADEMGYDVKFTDDGPKGYQRQADKEIGVREDLSPNETVHVLAHELAHAHGVNYDIGRGTAECIADAAAWVACDAIGLDVSGESVPYIAEWAQADDDVILRHGKWIDEIAHSIAGDHSQDNPERER